MFIGLEAEEYDRKYSDRTLLRRIFSYFAPYKKQMAIVITFLIISSLTNAIEPVIISIAINIVVSSVDFTILIFLIIIIFILNGSGWIFNYIRQKYSARAIGSVIYDIRKNAQNSVLNLDLSFYDKNPTGKIVSRINTDSNDFGDTVDLSIQVISSVAVLIILLIIVSFVNIILTLILLSAIPVFFIGAFLFTKFARKLTLLGQRALASVNSIIKESFSGIQIAKTFRQESKLYEKFNKVNKQAYGVNLRRAFTLNAIFPSLNLIQGLVLILLLYFGGNYVIAGTINIGEFNLFIQSLNLLFFPLLTIASFWPQFQSGLSASERIFAIIDTQPVVIQKGDIKPGKLKGEVNIQNLVFQYDANKKVFDNFSLKINPGESIAIVGHTGAGKSSLAKLLARFYEYQGGDILIDGKSIRDYDLKEYRRQIGLISQSPFLWADTVENNVKYSNESASKEDVKKVLEVSGGYEWVENLPEGLDTDVRERGSLLSMGQRQLVVFARVLLENPSILILDEATASIDPFTETRIQDALEKTMQGRTSIIIAHRLWTVRHVNRIVVLDHGKIVEQGNHDELMKQGGTYANLYDTYFRHQSLKYIEEMGKVEN
jgi:ATP-binding cassette subfamily B protein